MLYRSGWQTVFGLNGIIRRKTIFHFNFPSTFEKRFFKPTHSIILKIKPTRLIGFRGKSTFWKISKIDLQIDLTQLRCIGPCYRQWGFWMTSNDSIEIDFFKYVFHFFHQTHSIDFSDTFLQTTSFNLFFKIWNSNNRVFKRTHSTNFWKTQIHYTPNSKKAFDPQTR